MQISRQHDSIRSNLLEMRRELATRLRNGTAELINEKDDQDSKSHHPFDQSTSSCTGELLGTMTSMLRGIELALQKIESGHYGICEECERQIPEARLRAYPLAVRCVVCQSRLEGRTFNHQETGRNFYPRSPSEEVDDE